MRRMRSNKQQQCVLWLLLALLSKKSQSFQCHVTTNTHTSSHGNTHGNTHGTYGNGHTQRLPKLPSAWRIDRIPSKLYDTQTTAAAAAEEDSNSDLEDLANETNRNSNANAIDSTSSATSSNSSRTIKNINVKRRSFLSKGLTIATATATAASVPLAFPTPTSAKEDLLLTDPSKIVMSMDASNLPDKYATPSTKTSVSPATPAVVNEEISISSSVSSNGGGGSAAGGRFCDAEMQRINVFEKAAPSVVYIDTYVEQRDAFSTNVLEVPSGTGSGFVWDDRGHIVTNYHVIRQAQSAQIAVLSKYREGDGSSSSSSSTVSSSSSSSSSALNSKYKRAEQHNSNNSLPIRSSMRPGNPGVVDFTRRVYKARVVGIDPGKDIAVLKIDAPVFDLYPIDVGTSSNLRPGQSAYAIGNPFGLDHTLTVGVVSGIGREVKSPIGRPITNVIQTDAAINPGNSGGPLLDSSGKFIGMNTAIYSPSGGSAGIGFAIPADSVKFIVDTLIRDKKVVRPILGISLLESKQARALGIERGVLVLNVPTGSAAFKSGMRGTRRTEGGLIEIGDIIIQIDDATINTETDLFSALEMYKPGDTVKVTVNRPDLESPSSPKLKLKPKTLTIVLGASSELPTSQYLYNPH